MEFVDIGPTEFDNEFGNLLTIFVEDGAEDFEGVAIGMAGVEPNAGIEGGAGHDEAVFKRDFAIAEAGGAIDVGGEVGEEGGSGLGHRISPRGESV